MKKFLIGTIVLFLIGFFIGLVSSAENKQSTEMSVGASLSGERVVLDYLWRPNKIVWGVSVNNSNYTGTFKKDEIAVESLDISALVGYWSNKDKKNLFGWHTYIGTGFSSVDVKSKEYEANSSSVISNKMGLGVDLYLIRTSKQSLAITAEYFAVSHVINLKSRINDDGAIYKAISRQLTTQIGLRWWF